MKNKKKKMRLSKFTKLTLSALMVLTCVHFSSVKAEDSSVESSSSPETVEIVETPKVEETPAPVEEIVVESTLEPTTPEIVETTPEPTPEVVEATPIPTIEPVAEETPATEETKEKPVVEVSEESTEDEINTLTEEYELVDVITTEEETLDEETDDEGNTEDGEPTPVLFSVMLAEAADTQYSVELRNESNDVLENINLSSGNVKDEFSKVYATGYEKEGKKYSFKEARITQSEGLDYLPISYVAVYEDGIYYSTNSVTGTKLADGEKIVIILKEVVETFIVNYEVWVDGVLSTDYSNIVTLEGTESEVDINKTVNFVVSPKKGYTIANVTQNGVSLTVNGNQYTTSEINANTTIRIELHEKESSTISFKGSNTLFTYNEQSKNSDAINKEGGEWKFTVSANEITFKLTGFLQHSQNNKDLNKVSICLKYNGITEIDGIQLNLPTNAGEMKTTQISGDLYATVKKSENQELIGKDGRKERFSYVYTVTITSNIGKIYNDVEVTTNFKDTTTKELFVTSSIGVSTIKAYSYKGYFNWTEYDGKELYPGAANGGLLNLTDGRTYYFYFDVLDGYIPEASMITVSGTKDGKAITGVNVSKSKDLNKGTYMFQITADGSADYRLSVVATKAEYQLVYSDGIESSKKYNENESCAITTNRPAKEGLAFTGWTIDGDTTNILYKSNQALKIANIVKYAKWNPTNKIYEIKLNSNWIEAGKADSINYIIKIDFNDGTPTKTFEGTTKPGKNIKIFQNELEKQLGIDSEDYYLSSEQQEILNNTVITKDEQIISLNYIYRQEISVDSPMSITYDGKEHKYIPIITDKNNVEIAPAEENGLVNYEVSYSTNNFKDAHEITVTITGKNKFKGIVTRTYSINRKAVTVTADSKTKQFGEADPVLTATVTGVVDSYEIAYTVTRAEGESNGTYPITVSGEKEQGNYTVSYESGTLTITAKSIEGEDSGLVVEKLADVTYNGQPQKQKPVVKDGEVGLVEGTDYTLGYSEDTTNVGTVTVKVIGQGNYSGTLETTYQITRAAVTVTADSKTKQFGEADPVLTATVTGVVDSYEIAYTVTRAEGESNGTYPITVSGEKEQGNYTVSYESGTLTITAKSIEGEDSGLVVEKLADVTYNGQPQKQKPVVKDGEVGLVEGTDYTLGYSEDTTNVGTVTVKVIGQGNYSGTLETTYLITARKVTLTSGSASKEYDGKPLTKAGVVISEDGFVEDEVADVLAVGTITNVGSVDNTIKIIATDKFNENNYFIKYELGKLTVTEKNNPKPEPTEEPKGCPVDTIWNEEKGICEKAVVVPVVPGGGNKPKATPEPTIAPSETPEASATPTIEPTSTPKPSSSAETGIIEDAETPTAARKAHWALINLIAAIGSVLFGLLLLLSKNKKDNDNEDEDATDEEETQKRNKVWKVVSLVDAIIAVVVFVLTENMKQPMVLVDKWTILMILFTLISIVSFAFGRKYHEEDNTAENA